MKKIAILYGSPSSEREISNYTAQNISINLASYKPVMVEWTLDNHFIVKDINGKSLLPKPLSLKELIYLAQKKNVFFVNALHGEYGEDGYIQKIFEENKISFSGPSAKAAELSFDKYKTNELLKTDLNIPCSLKFTKENFKPKEMKSVNFPIILKPNASGSSIGLMKIFDIAELNQAIENLQPKTDYLIQECIDGREFSMGTVWNGEIFYNLAPTEIITRGKLFDYHQKYAKDGALEVTPAEISPEITRDIQEAAKTAHKKLNLGFYSRSDFILQNKSEKIYFLEVNSLPGFTNTSILPAELKYAGMYEKFFDDLVSSTL